MADNRIHSHLTLNKVNGKLELKPYLDGQGNLMQNDPRWTAFSDVLRAYRIWCDENGEKPMQGNTLGRLLKARGFTPDRGGSPQVRIVRGIVLDPQAFVARPRSGSTARD